MSRLEDAMKVSVLSGGGALARTDDQPLDLRQVLTALGAALVRAGTDRDLPAIFEQQVQQLSMRTVRLREIPARYHARLVTPTRTSESIVVGVHTLKSYLLYPQRTRRSRTQVSA